MCHWFSDEIVRFKIEVGAEEKIMHKDVTLNTRKMVMPAASLQRMTPLS